MKKGEGRMKRSGLSLLLFLFLSAGVLSAADQSVPRSTDVEGVVDVTTVSSSPQGRNPIQPVWFAFEYVEVLKPYKPGDPLPEGMTTRRFRQVTFLAKAEKIHSRSQLLMKFLGPDYARNMNLLTSSQKNILEMFDHSRSQAMANRLSWVGQSGQAPNNALPVIICDTRATTGISPDKLKAEVWPYSSDDKIVVSDVPGVPRLGPTLAHEAGHLIQKNGHAGYGLMNGHSINEVTNTQTAFVEGWAECNDLLDFPGQYQLWKQILNTSLVKDTSPSTQSILGGKDSPKVSGNDLLACEGINAMILYDLAKKFGGKKVFDSFMETDRHGANLGDFLHDFVTRNPGSLNEVISIIDEWTGDKTGGKLPDSEIVWLLGFFPPDQTIQAALSKRVRSKLYPQSRSAAKGGTGTSKTPKPPVPSTASNTPQPVGFQGVSDGLSGGTQDSTVGAGETMGGETVVPDSSNQPGSPSEIPAVFFE